MGRIPDGRPRTRSLQRSRGQTTRAPLPRPHDKDPEPPLTERPTTSELDTVSHKLGEQLLAELKWVHDAIRHDLRVCRKLAAEVERGASPEQVHERIQSLKTNGPLWRLRANCLHYCRFVHSHHRAEDILLFTAVRRSSPELTPAVDRLEADHREVSGRLEEIETAASALLERGDADARDRVVRALEAVSDVLLSHLTREEELIGPIILGWKQWPWADASIAD
jgi:iron-sulfur cluster repair protein YtfE (RIC family)